MERSTKATLVALLAAANITFTCTNSEIRLRGATGPNNEGTEGACTVFYFDALGELTGVGVWDALPVTREEPKAA